MKRVFLLVPLVLFGCHSEKDIRDRVVELTSTTSLCSGTQIRSHGRDYVLTAAHCADLAKGDEIMTQLPGQRPLPRRILEVSEETDLMLLEGMPGLPGLDLAENESPQELVATFTHGLGLATHRSIGELIQRSKVQVPVFTIDDEKTEADCNLPKYKASDVEGIFGTVKVCFLDIEAYITNADIQPGSSGGTVVNAEGDLIGVAFASNSERMSFIVPLDQIKHFLEGY